MVKKKLFITALLVTAITIVLALGHLLKPVITVILLPTNYPLDIGPAKIYGPGQADQKPHVQKTESVKSK